MTKVGLLIGDEFIEAQKAFLYPEHGIQLPQETVIELLRKHEISEWREIQRNDEDYPFEYRFPFKGIEIYFISEDTVFFD